MVEAPTSTPKPVSKSTTSGSWHDWGASFYGTGILQLQAVLIAVGLAVWIFLLVVRVPSWFPATLVFTLCIGNWSAAVVNGLRSSFGAKPAPWNWIIFVVVVLVGGISGSVFADTIMLLVFRVDLGELPKRVLADAPIGTMVTLVFGIVSFRFEEQRDRMEARQRELQAQVQLGQIKEQSHKAELAQAHEIQRHLMPRETPQIAGFQIACAWQPAKSVSGDYFDVLPLDEGRLGLCIADVSGKGITAGVTYGQPPGFGESIRQGINFTCGLVREAQRRPMRHRRSRKFVTFFYGVIETQQRRLQYENAGHCLPLLVHADGSILMPGEL